MSTIEFIIISHLKTILGDINELVQRLNEVIAKSDDHKYLKHQKDKYGNIPLWALTRVLTLGNISKTYSLLTPSVQSNISKEFVDVNEAMLSRMIDMLSRVRNVCAHNERLYDYQYNEGSISNMPVHKALKLKSVIENYVIGKKDLFAVVIIFKYCLKQSDFIVFIDKMNGLIYKLLNSTNVIQRTQILKLMV